MNFGTCKDWLAWALHYFGAEMLLFCIHFLGEEDIHDKKNIASQAQEIKNEVFNLMILGEAKSGKSTFIRYKGKNIPTKVLQTFFEAEEKDKIFNMDVNEYNKLIKCNNAFRDIADMCNRYFVDYIFTFGNADKDGIMFSAKWNKRKKEKVNNLFIVSSKILDVRSTILKAIKCINMRKSPGLVKIAEELEVKVKGEYQSF